MAVSGTFISYREDDAKGWALLLHDDLVEVFGEQQVFLDKDALQAGGWREQLQLALDRCGAVLVVIGRHWLDAQDCNGARRLDDPNDVHRHEIATALARKDVTVIPVLVDGASLPLPEELPEDIRTLVDQQARSLGDRSIHRALDLKVLVGDIERATGAVVFPRSSSRGKRISWPFWLASLALIFTSIYIGVEIDYRHWTWVIFLVLVPVAVATVLVLRLRRKV